MYTVDQAQERLEDIVMAVAGECESQLEMQYRIDEVYLEQINGIIAALGYNETCTELVNLWNDYWADQQ